MVLKALEFQTGDRSLSPKLNYSNESQTLFQHGYLLQTFLHSYSLYFVDIQTELEVLSHGEGKVYNARGECESCCQGKCRIIVNTLSLQSNSQSYPM